MQVGVWLAVCGVSHCPVQCILAAQHRVWCLLQCYEHYMCCVKVCTHAVLCLVPGWKDSTELALPASFHISNPAPTSAHPSVHCCLHHITLLIFLFISLITVHCSLHHITLLTLLITFCCTSSAVVFHRKHTGLDCPLWEGVGYPTLVPIKKNLAQGGTAAARTVLESVVQALAPLLREPEGAPPVAQVCCCVHACLLGSLCVKHGLMCVSILQNLALQPSWGPGSKGAVITRDQ